MDKYSINIFWSDEDNGYIAVTPEFPGLSAFGNTPEEAVAEARVALKLFIETHEDEGLPLPEPQIAQQYSGQIRVRFPKSLHYQLARKAELEGNSLNLIIVNACQSAVTGEQVGQRLVSEIKKLFNENAVALASLVGFSNKPSFKEKTVTTERELIFAPGLDLKKGGN